MGISLCQEEHLEHVHIEYEGGALTIRVKEYQQTLKLFKKIRNYGEGNVVVSSSAWYEMEQTIKRNDHRSFAMLFNGEFMNLEPPTREN